MDDARITRRLKVRHKTTYAYEGQVETSKHFLHLRPWMTGGSACCLIR